MSGSPALPALPDGYALEVGERGRVAWLAELAPELRRAGFGPDRDPALSPSGLAGRWPLFAFDLAGGSALVRRYHHGGLLRWLTRDRFHDPGRPFRELVVSARLRAAGIATPEVLAARARRVGAAWRLEVVTRRVPDAIDLGYVLARARAGELSRARRARIAAAVGRLVAGLHQQGCRHADLTLNNMLIERAALEGDERREPAVWILDLEGAALADGPLPDAARRANLARLWRFVEKRGVGPGAGIRHGELRRFFEGYDPSGARWREDWRRVRAAHARNRPAHSLGRALDRLFAGPRDARFERAPTRS